MALIASGGVDGIVCVWQVDSMELLGKYGPFSAKISAFFVAGEWIAVASENLVEVWGYKRRKNISSSCEGKRYCLLASPDGDLLIDHKLEWKKTTYASRFIISRCRFLTSIILDP